jgi:hypothetical protein
MDPTRRFEGRVLRPLWVLLVLAGVAFALSRNWWMLAACVAGAIDVGIIGSKLHPLLPAGQFVLGSQGGPTAPPEVAILSPEVQALLVNRACTHVAILFGVAAGIGSWLLFGLAWYANLAVALTLAFVTGVILLLWFKGEPPR